MRLAIAALLPLLAGCSAFTTLYGNPGAERRVRPLPVAGTSLIDWKGIVHCHSYLSHDSDGQLADIDEGCRSAGIDFVVMTDHQTDASVRDGCRGFRGDTLFVVGAEVRSPQGTLIAFPLQKPLRRFQHAGLLVREAAAQGAIALICHAEMFKAWDVPGLAGVEVVNLHAAAMQRNPVVTLLVGVLFPLRFLFERLCHRDPDVFANWDRQLLQRHPLAPTGGSDAHANVRIFGPAGGTIGTYREVFLTMSTHVLAERLDEASLVEAIRMGRTYVAFDIFGEGAGFDFRAVDGERVEVGGATVKGSPGLRLCVRVPAEGLIELWRDGVVVRRAAGRELVEAVPAAGVYRVEVRTTFGTPWLFSSSIKVE